ncbi:hypothetical protein CJD36_018355 [Flavipsychrobacter stenotrophus]|uniref:Uncharacterized protein n=1 Tax=Flavipsychrobacter stenotrophus TaxID=2077091 RepID=A0A2S7STG5_9BACT|nr:hypothetical protein [Flavipsychrobacter stenotrophus]PQJ09885.1 hypothetical protein CJD36_018355 [Flavipsychrobacter stenotrophus]
MNSFPRIFLVLFIALISCGTARKKSTITMTSVNYDKKSDKTTYMVFPYGSVTMKGKWREGAYNHPSRQQYFRRADSLRLGVAIGSARKLEFYKEGMSGATFSNAYCEWETKYMKESLHQKTELIKTDNTHGYTIWRAYSDSVNIVQLCAASKCACNEPAFKTLTINTWKMTTQQVVQLLEEIYATE